jgi:fatty acid desaturase
LFIGGVCGFGRGGHVVFMHGVASGALMRGPVDGEARQMGDAGTSSRLEPSFWRDTLASYAMPDVRRALLDVATSAIPYLLLTALMYRGLRVSALLVVALAIPTSGFLVRTFIVFHDCSHGSFLASRRANAWLGACGASRDRR